ncbi:hypothetical protein F9C07_850 [Aspergillus flavus]|uniref:Uncharacterized protein n=1 Tax=Aspergillus flavus (strain ATCC 200026 / FGSC A1120 / IAM 13836 / NRRL 3357 / JCM 12722 / SRRC 167) TaxID=332952 RepID=A0A7U2MQA7_ASPFN|nr:hypothetical protein F9C07_850 [Aspergillus flavus]
MSPPLCTPVRSRGLGLGDPEESPKGDGSMKRRFLPLRPTLLFGSLEPWRKKMEIELLAGFLVRVSAPVQ